MIGEPLHLMNQATLDARWRELQKESARTTDNAVINRNATEMAAIVSELENRRHQNDRDRYRREE